MVSKVWWYGWDKLVRAWMVVVLSLWGVGCMDENKDNCEQACEGGKLMGIVEHFVGNGFAVRDTLCEVRNEIGTHGKTRPVRICRVYLISEEDGKDFGVAQYLFETVEDAAIYYQDRYLPEEDLFKSPHEAYLRGEVLLVISTQREADRGYLERYSGLLRGYLGEE